MACEQKDSSRPVCGTVMPLLLRNHCRSRSTSDTSEISTENTLLQTAVVGRASGGRAGPRVSSPPRESTAKAGSPMAAGETGWPSPRRGRARRAGEAWVAGGGGGGGEGGRGGPGLQGE